MRLYEINERKMGHEPATVKVVEIKPVTKPVYFSSAEVNIGTDIPTERAEFIDTKTGSRVRFKETHGSGVMVPEGTFSKGDEFKTTKDYTFHYLPDQLEKERQKVINVALEREKKKKAARQQKPAGRRLSPGWEDGPVERGNVTFGHRK